MKSAYDFIEDLKIIEQVAISRNYPGIDIYFLGGSGCILGKYLDRMTYDVDIIIHQGMGHFFDYLENMIC